MTRIALQIDPEVARDLLPHLAEGEDIVWAGRPVAARFARLRMRLVMAGLFWIAVSGAGFYGFGVTLLSDEYAGIALGLRVLVLAIAAAPFGIIGILALGGHVLLLRRRAERTLYGLTDRRVLVASPTLWLLGPTRIRSLDLERVGDVTPDTDEDEPAALDVHDARGVEEPLRLASLAAAADVAIGIRVAAASAHAKRC